jgi:hypothetical protein
MTSSQHAPWQRSLASSLASSLAVFSLTAGLSAATGLSGISHAFKLPKPPKILSTPIVQLSSLDAQLQSPPPITTRFTDARNQIFLPDDFGKDALYKPLSDLPKSDRGSFLLPPGFYELTVQSYSLQVGAQGPTANQGYLSAPLQGPKQAAIQTLLRNSHQHPDRPQREIQLLLWAILSRASLSSLNAQLQTLAMTLLAPAQIAELNHDALAALNPDALRLATSQLPASTQQALTAENQIRHLLSQGGSFEALEAVALRSGAPERSTDIPLGRWSDHAGGYFVRYFPTGYSRTRIQVYVPDRLPRAAEYDPSGDVAVPSSASSQRLAQSARELPPDPKPAAVPAAPVNLPKPENVLENLPDRIPVIRVPVTGVARP